MLRLYADPISGNGYKVRLVLTQLGIAFEYVALDIMKGETRTPGFLAKNPTGRIPTLRLDDGTYLAESNAIMIYLAEGTPLWPGDRLHRAQTLQWLFFEQYSHEPNVATPRFWMHLPKLTEHQQREMPERVKRGYAALDVMERHLSGRPYFVGERYGLADIALYAYTHVAHEGGFDLARHPQIRAWLDRVASQPNHIEIGAPAGVTVAEAA